MLVSYLSLQACKGSLRQLGPLLGSERANDMFQKHLLGEGSLLYGEFINDLTKALVMSLISALVALSWVHFVLLNSPCFFLYSKTCDNGQLIF
jgi:hypothetical protein